jgi:hypothetical protein
MRQGVRDKTLRWQGFIAHDILDSFPRNFKIGWPMYRSGTILVFVKRKLKSSFCGCGVAPQDSGRLRILNQIIDEALSVAVSVTILKKLKAIRTVI